MKERLVNKYTKVSITQKCCKLFLHLNKVYQISYCIFCTGRGQSARFGFKSLNSQFSLSKLHVIKG